LRLQARSNTLNDSSRAADFVTKILTVNDRDRRILYMNRILQMLSYQTFQLRRGVAGAQ
jgi:hypothetical protein